MNDPGGPYADVDYAVPADVPSSRKRDRRTPGTPGLWGGRGRTALVVGCWVGALGLLLVLVVPLLGAEEAGADSPEDAVAQLLQGIADVDPVAVVGAIDPEEARDPARAQDAYDRMNGRLLRRGEVPPADVTRVLDAVDGQAGGADLTTVAILAAVDLDLVGLDLRADPDPTPGSGTRVFVVDGDLEVSLDPDRLPDSVDDIGRASYTMPLAEGWRRDRQTSFEPFLVTVERDGRWYVSLEESATALLGTDD